MTVTLWAVERNRTNIWSGVKVKNRPFGSVNITRYLLPPLPPPPHLATVHSYNQFKKTGLDFNGWWRMFKLCSPKHKTKARLLSFQPSVHWVLQSGSEPLCHLVQWIYSNAWQVKSRQRCSQIIGQSGKESHMHSSSAIGCGWILMAFWLRRLSSR